MNEKKVPIKTKAIVLGFVLCVRVSHTIRAVLNNPLARLAFRSAATNTQPNLSVFRLVVFLLNNPSSTLKRCRCVSAAVPAFSAVYI